MNGVLTALRTEAARCRDMRFGELPNRTRTTAHHSLLDWLGCAVAGATEDASRLALEALAPDPGSHVVIGSRPVAGWRDAILLNGVHGHALDFDDMLPEIQGHPSAAVFPALFILGDDRGSTVAEVLEAYVAGVEIGAWVARRVMPEHYDVGWHGTGTMGVFAAAAACAKLLDLDEDQWISALDFAATQSAGLRSLFGTPGKPLHAGKSAEAGALAARLSRAGAVSHGQGLTAERGFFTVYGAGKTAPAEPAGNTWALDGVLYKVYASCYMTQSVVDGALEMRERAGGAPITAIEVTVSPKLRDVCAIEDPQNANEAKFSVHATTALGLLGHDLASEQTFSPEALAGAGYRALRERVTLTYDDQLAGNEPRSRMRVELDSGTVLETDRDRGLPERDLAAREATLTRKVRGLVEPLLGSRAVTDLIATALDPSSALGDLRLGDLRLDT